MLSCVSMHVGVAPLAGADPIGIGSGEGDGDDA